MTLWDFYRKVYTPFRLLGASPTTLVQIECVIRAFEAFIKRPATIEDLYEDTIVAWMQSMIEAGRAAATVNGAVGRLMTMARLAHRRKLLAQVPQDVERLRRKRNLPRAWTEKEFARLLESAGKATEKFRGVPAGNWWTILLLVMYDTGMRLSSVLAVKFSWIALEEKVLRVPGAYIKNGVGQTFALHSQTVAAILASIPPARPMLLPLPWKCRRPLYYRLRVILNRAGLPYGRKDLFHRVRRTTASHLAKTLGEGVAAKLLGHQDGSTIKRYVDPTFMADHDSAKYLPRPNWKESAELIVELVDAPPEARNVIQIARASLSPEAGEYLEKLSLKQAIRPREVHEALALLGIRHAQFARLIGLRPVRFGRVINGQTRITRRVQRLIRVGLGLTFTRGSGEVMRHAKALGAEFDD